jgi:hypothetical protein
VGLIDEAGLERLVAEGCPRCRSPRLRFGAYLDGALPIMAAEPVGKLTWVYDGEKFIDGVFEVSCADCNTGLFTADVCPRCHADGGLARALETTNRWPVPAACPSCEGEELRYIAMVPARVSYEGRRAGKPQCGTELLDEGFHGYRVDCRSCRTVALRETCPLCDAPPPLRVRPG